MRSISLLIVIALALIISTVPTSAVRQESFEGFIAGVRANAVKGGVLYQRGDGKFDLEPGLKLQDGDFIKSSANSYAELLLQPGNYLRVGGETEFQIVSDQHDRMRFKLNDGAMTFEILSRDMGMLPSFSYSVKHAEALIRVITPNATVFISEPGIFRINAVNNGQTELIVREGEATINGRRVKKKRSAVASASGVTTDEVDRKNEDNFDVWARERAKYAIDANRSLKKDSAWANNRREGRKVEFPHDDKDNRAGHVVVSVKPGFINFTEAGVELNRRPKEWQQLTEEELHLETGDKLRTAEHSFAEITVLPEMHLRLDQNSEILFEQLSHDSISIKLVRGSAILDVARFDSSQGLPLTFSGLATSVVIAGEGNYRVDIRPNGDEITVRKGKVIFNESPVEDCRRITAGKVSECDKKRVDNFDFWSEYRGEGVLVDEKRPVLGRLTALRRERFRDTGFWYQNRGQTTYIFVPFTSPNFRSPYGGHYSTVLTPRNMPMRRVDMENDSLFRLPGLETPRPRP